MKLNLLSDSSGRAMERALSRAFKMGYEDARKLRKRGAKVRSLKTGLKLSGEICSQCHPEHVAYLRSAYSAGQFQYDNTH